MQYVLWNLIVTGNHNDWNLRLKTFYFGRDQMPIHLWHVVVDDHCRDCADCCNL